MTKPIINLEHIAITFYQKKREIEAVKDVSITIDKGTISFENGLLKII